MKHILFIILLIVVVSCKKFDNVTPDTKAQTKELVAGSTFDWKTTKEITLNIVGMKDINPTIINTLYIKSSIGDTIYYKDLLLMSNDYVIKFAAPSTETKVNLSYGSKIQIIDLLSNTITFDYIIQ